MADSPGGCCVAAQTDSVDPNVTFSALGAPEGNKCQIDCSARFYAGWDSMIFTSSANHSALAGEASRQLNAGGAVEERLAKHSFRSACECPVSLIH